MGNSSTKKNHHVDQGEEGCQACRPPPLCQHDHGRHQGAEGQEGILPPGHPQVCGGHQGSRPCEARPEEDGCCQEGGCRCCCRQEGSRILQTACQGAKGQEAQGCQEACCQEGQKASGQEGEEASS